MARCFLALDLGARLGWALQLPDGRLQYGTQALGVGQDEREGRRFYKLLVFLNETTARITAAGGELEQVYYEDSGGWFPPGRANAARALLGFRGVLLAWCERHRIPYRGVPVSTIKKQFAGSGRADKDAMVAAAERRGFKVTNHNEADALGLLLTRPAIARDREAA